MHIFNKSQFLHFPKTIKTISIGLCLFSMSVHSQILIMGGENTISTELATYLNQDIEVYREQSNPGDLIYANIGLMNDDDIATLRQALVTNKLAVLDFSSIPAEEQRTELSKQLTGVGMTSEYLVSGQLNGESVVNAILTQMESENMSEEQIKESTLRSFIYVLKRFGFGDK